MATGQQPDFSPIPKQYDLSCLAQLLSAAAIANGGIENPGIAMLVEDNVFFEAASGDRELMCHNCAVTGTLKRTDEGMWPLTHDRSPCATES